MVLSLNKRVRIVWRLGQGLRSLREIAIEVNCSHETVTRAISH
jgi:Trp operon repressor